MLEYLSLRKIKRKNVGTLFEDRPLVETHDAHGI